MLLELLLHLLVVWITVRGTSPPPQMIIADSAYTQTAKTLTVYKISLNHSMEEQAKRQRYNKVVSGARVLVE